MRYFFENTFPYKGTYSPTTFNVQRKMTLDFEELEPRSK